MIKEVFVVDGETGWSVWSSWSECKEGIKSRSRLCNSPTPTPPQPDCDGDFNQTESCSFECGDRNVTDSDYCYCGQDIMKYSDSIDKHCCASPREKCYKLGGHLVKCGNATVVPKETGICDGKCVSSVGSYKCGDTDIESCKACQCGAETMTYEDRDNKHCCVPPGMECYSDGKSTICPNSELISKETAVCNGECISSGDFKCGNETIGSCRKCLCGDETLEYKDRDTKFCCLPPGGHCSPDEDGNMRCGQGSLTTNTFFCGDLKVGGCSQCLCGGEVITYESYHNESQHCCVPHGKECYFDSNNSVICDNSTKMNIVNNTCNGECVDKEKFACSTSGDKCVDYGQICQSEAPICNDKSDVEYCQKNRNTRVDHSTCDIFFINETHREYRTRKVRKNNLNNCQYDCLSKADEEHGKENHTQNIEYSR